MIEGQDQPAGTYVSASWDPPSTPPPPPNRRTSNARTWIQLAFRFVLIVLPIWGGLQRAAYHRSHSHAPVVHQGGVARSDQFHGSGRIYLLQVGPHADPYTVQDLAEWLRDKYSLDTQVVATSCSTPPTWTGTKVDLGQSLWPRETTLAPLTLFLLSANFRSGWFSSSQITRSTALILDLCSSSLAMVRPTLEGCLLPKCRPMSWTEASVVRFIKYIAIWRGTVTALILLLRCNSSTDIPKKYATARSIALTVGSPCLLPE